VIRILPHGPDVLGALRDLSEGGCGIELGMAIPAQVGTHVEVSLHVDGMNLKRAGIIRRIDVIRRIERETRAGIQFMAGSGNGADMLRQLMKGVLPKADTNRQAGV
jgi:c-di-GMP-binding flagellar brake protein YcgR